MKFVVLLFVMVTAAQAERITVQRENDPDYVILKRPLKIRYQRIEANSDRSVTVFEPKFYLRGKWRGFIGEFNEHDHYNAICKLLSPRMVHVVDSVEFSSKEETGLLWSLEGTFVVDKDTHARQLLNITCRKS